MTGDFQREITICTVVTPLHKRLAAINHRLVAALNPGAEVRWIIAEAPDLGFPSARVATLFLRTHPIGRQFAMDWGPDYFEVLKARHFELDPIVALIPDATVVPGPTVAQTLRQAALRHGLTEAEAEERLSENIGSYQHAAGLNATLSQVRTRYAVVIDPDLYVVRPDWIGDVIAHMQRRDLSVFGVPWHPRWYEKQRGFPAPHLMVIDLALTGPVAELMDPGMRSTGDRFVSATWQAFVQVSRTDARSAHGALLRRLGAAIGEDLRQRRTIGRARDTGHAMAAAVAAAGGRAETVQAVFRPETGFWPDSVSPMQTLPEALLPEAWRYRPRCGTVSAGGFREAGYPDVGARTWEEFMWAGTPFAFHLRGDPQRRTNWRVDHDGLLADLDLILATLGRPALERPMTKVLGMPPTEARRARLLAWLLYGDPEEDEAVPVLAPDDERPGMRDILRTAANQALRGLPGRPASIEIARRIETLATALPEPHPRRAGRAGA